MTSDSNLVKGERCIFYPIHSRSRNNLFRDLHTAYRELSALIEFSVFIKSHISFIYQTFGKISERRIGFIGRY